MTFHSDLKSVTFTDLDHLDAAANRMSMLDGECELVGRSGPTQTKYEYYHAISTRELMYCTTKHGPYNPPYQCYLHIPRYFHFSPAPAKRAAQQSSPPHSVAQQVPQIHPHRVLRSHE